MEVSTYWKCNVCGYVHQGAEAPELCPVCGADQSAFVALQITSTSPTKKSEVNRWKCSVCGFEHQGQTPPEQCPVCSALAQLFTPIEEETKLTQVNHGESIIIIGSGIAAVAAAEQARLVNEQATISIIAKEKTLPYYRMNLTRYLAGEINKDALALKPEKWYQDNRVTIIYDEVKSIDREAKSITLLHGGEQTYDRLILANGSHAFIPTISGSSLPGVYVLRTLGDADAILDQAKVNAKVLVIGGGLLGLETAGALSQKKCEVGLVEGHGWLLPRQLTQLAGSKLKKYVEKLGIHVYSQAKTKSFNGDERVRSVTLEDGQELPVDFVIICAGVRCNSYLARLSDLRVNRGVVVDDNLFTSDPAILAAGDIAEHDGICYGIWPASHAQGIIAGTNAAGGDALFTGMPPSTRLKVLGIDLVSIGQIQGDDASYEIVEQDLADSYQLYVIHDGALVGAILYGDISDVSLVMDAIEKKIPLAENHLLAQRLETLAKTGVHPVSSN